jgi:hypothetical protein
MAWEKIVKRIGLGCCPKCRNPGFDYQEGADPQDDESAAVECSKCGWKGILREMRFTPEPDFDMQNIVRHAPELAGLLCEAFICEAYVFEGELVANANVVYLRFAGAWHKLVIDCGVIIWRPFQYEPSPSAIPSKGCEYPHVDVGAIAGVVGRRLRDYTMETAAAKGKVTFVFDNDRTVIIDNESDISSFSIV